MKLIPRTKSIIRTKGYSLSTERVYVGWIKRFIYFHKLKNPIEMGEEEILAFLNHLANDLNVSSNTQNQALTRILHEPSYL